MLLRRHGGLPTRRRHGEPVHFTTPTRFRSVMMRRSCEAITSVGFGVNVGQHWTSLSSANVRSPGQFTIDGTQTGLASVLIFLLGRMGVSGLTQAAPNTLDMDADIPRVVRSGHVEVKSPSDAELWFALGALFPQQLVNGAVYQFDHGRFKQRMRSTVFPNRPRRTVLPWRSRASPRKAGMLTHWKNFAPRVGPRVGSDGRGAHFGARGLQPRLRIRERAVPPQYVGCPPVGFGGSTEQSPRGPG